MYERILERLLHPSEDVRLDALKLVETWGDEASTMLLDLVDLGIHDPSDTIREAILRLLASFSSRTALIPGTLGPFLGRVLSSDDLSLLSRGVRMLTTLGSLAPPDTFRSFLQRLRFKLFTTLKLTYPAESPERASWFQHLFALLKVGLRYPDDLHVRLEAFRTLESLAKDSPPDRPASQAKYALDWPSLRPALEDALSDKSSRVRIRACRFLADLKAYALEAIPLLLRRSNERQSGVFSTAIQTLRSLLPFLPDPSKRFLEQLHHPYHLSTYYGYTTPWPPTQRVEFVLSHGKAPAEILPFFACKCAERALWLAYRAGQPAPIEAEINLQLQWSLLLGKITRLEAKESLRSISSAPSSSPSLAAVHAALLQNPEKAAKNASLAAQSLARTLHPNLRRTPDDRAELEAGWQIARLFDLHLRYGYPERLGSLLLPLTSTPPQTQQQIVLESALFD